MKKVLIILGVIILIIAIPIVTVLSMAGFVPVLSHVIGADKPKDLGVRATYEDYLNLCKKVGVKFIPAPSSGKATDYKKVFSGSRKIDRAYTQEELTAMLNFNKPSYWVIHNTQVRIHADGTLEGSSLINIKELKNSPQISNEARKYLKTLPNKVAVYVSGKVEIIGNNRVKLDVNKVEVGKLPIPGNFLTQENVNLANDYINSILSDIPNLDIQSVTYSDGNVNFKGIVPEELKRIPIKETK